jgi:cytoskeletal protein CcmA (bactofilin family)
MNNRCKLFPNDKLNAPKTVVSESTDQEGGTMRLKGGGLIDGKLKGVTIIVSDDSFLRISALATLDACVIHCKDIFIEGIVSGDINAKGDVELGESCTVMGSINHGGALMISALADTVEMHTRKVAQVNSTGASNAQAAHKPEESRVLALGN